MPDFEFVELKRKNYRGDYEELIGIFLIWKGFVGGQSKK